MSSRFSKSPAIRVIETCNKLYNDPIIQCNSYSQFKCKLRPNLFPITNRTPTTHLKLGIKNETYLNRMRVGLLLKSHKFAHNFEDTPTPVCRCGYRNQNECHFFLDCTLLDNNRQTLLGSLTTLGVGETFSALSKIKKIDFLLYGLDCLTVKTCNFDLYLRM